MHTRRPQPSSLDPRPLASWLTALTALAALLTGCTSVALAEPDSDPDGPTGTRPLALVYKGYGTCDGCPESLAHLLARAGYETRFVGPEALRTDATFEGATLYAQGGDDETMQLRKAVGASAWPGVVQRLRRFVDGGGRYLGICAGGYIAGRWLDGDGTIDALDFLEGDVSAFTGTSGDPTEDQLVPITWTDPPSRRQVFFQEGPYFTARGTVLARYADGKTAALATHFGRGAVVVSGVHLEAEADWFSGANLHDPDGVDIDLGLLLVAALAR